MTNDRVPDPAPPRSEGDEAAAPPTAAAGGALVDTLRLAAIAACVGAAAIHFAYAPGHFDEATSHGVFFLAVAWAQVAAAVGLARWHRRPAAWWFAAGANAAVIAVWAMSRTVGVTGDPAESVGLADLVATGLEAVVVAASLVALRAPVARRAGPRVPVPLAAAAALALAVLVSVSVTPSIAGEHDHGDEHDHGTGTDEVAVGTDDHGEHDDHGDDHADEHGDEHAAHDEGAAAAVDTGDRCDMGFNTAAFNEASEPGTPHAHDDTGGVDFTIEEWADVFVDPDGQFPAAAVLAYLDDNPVLRDSILSGGLTHTLEPDPWNPMTDESECEKLAAELQRTREITRQYPTIADAEAAGYRRVTDYLPGIAAHFIKYEYVDDKFVLEEPEMLLYDGDGPDATITGLSYYIIKPGDEPPTDGFTGDNDHYHRHVGLCFKDGVVISGSNTSQEECEKAGGRKSDGTAGWMSHVWNVPGCESDWGLFSGANPKLSVRGLDNTAARPPGCGTGTELAADLAFDDPGDGPSV